VQKNKKGLPKNFVSRYQHDYVEELVNEKIIHKVKEIDVKKIKPDSSQPRKLFDENSLKELASSIKEKGVLQPILVRKENGSYVIISGERRWKASILAGKKTIPVIELSTTNRKEIKEIQIIENLQREDITPLERAYAIKEYLEPVSEGKKIKTLLINYRMGRKTPEKFAHTVSALCKIAGKSPITLERWISLLDLPEDIQKKIDDPNSPITSRHIEQLLKIKDVKMMMEIVKLIEKENLSSEEVKKIVKKKKRTDPFERVMKDINRIKRIKDKKKVKKGLLQIKKFIDELIKAID
jgi:ParB family chromosome partitioning protein